jgi:nucleotide-binding universal stress UspA family protein
MKILMAMDDSRFAEDRLRAVLTRAHPQQTEVLVLHVLQPLTPPPPQMGAGYAPELADEKADAQALLDGVAERLRSAGFKVQTQVELGDARARILDCAEDWGADLIIMGSHGHNGFQRFLLGSVPEFVARHAKCSVEIVRSRAKA